MNVTVMNVLSLNVNTECHSNECSVCESEY